MTKRGAVRGLAPYPSIKASSTESVFDGATLLDDEVDELELDELLLLELTELDDDEEDEELDDGGAEDEEDEDTTEEDDEEDDDEEEDDEVVLVVEEEEEDNRRAAAPAITIITTMITATITLLIAVTFRTLFFILEECTLEVPSLLRYLGFATILERIAVSRKSYFDLAGAALFFLN